MHNVGEATKPERQNASAAGGQCDSELGVLLSTAELAEGAHVTLIAMSVDVLNAGILHLVASGAGQRRLSSAATPGRCPGIARCNDWVVNGPARSDISDEFQVWK